MYMYLWKGNTMLVHNQIGKATNLYEKQSLFTEVDIYRKIGYDQRITENDSENNLSLINILKNSERLKQIQYLQSIMSSPDEVKIQAVKDLEEECDIRPSSILQGGLYNNWQLDGEFEG